VGSNLADVQQLGPSKFRVRPEHAGSFTLDVVLKNVGDAVARHPTVFAVSTPTSTTVWRRGDKADPYTKGSTMIELPDVPPLTYSRVPYTVGLNVAVQKGLQQFSLRVVVWGENLAARELTAQFEIVDASTR